MFNQNTYSNKMSKTLEVFTNELNSLRTGRANASMLDLIRIEVYGQKMPINQLATVTTPEPRTINIQVWDTNNVQLIDSSIKKSELGLNPQTEGSTIRIPIPELSEDRRIELVKVAGKYSEQAKISIRNVRRDIIETTRKLEKESIISEDEKSISESKIQIITDEFINEIDDMLAQKEKDIKSV